MKGAGRGRGRKGRGRGKNNDEPETPAKPGAMASRENKDEKKTELPRPVSKTDSTLEQVSKKTGRPKKENLIDAMASRENKDEKKTELPRPVSKTDSTLEQVSKKTGRPKKENLIDAMASRENKDEKKTEQPRPVSKTGSTLEPVSKKTGTISLPERPGYGKAGRKIRLTANFFELNYKDNEIYHYDIAIEPTKCPASLNRKVVERLAVLYQQVFGGHKPVFDGRKNLYTVRPLPIGNDRKEFIVKYHDEEDPRERQFKVSVKWVACSSMQSLSDAFRRPTNPIPYETLQAMDIALRHLPSLRYVPVGRSFFSPSQGRDSLQLGQGRELWFGYHQSVRPACWKTMVNLDISSTAFYKAQPMVEFLNEVLGKDFTGKDRRELHDYERLTFLKESKGLKVEVTHLGSQKRKYRVTGVTKESANCKKFTMEKDGAQVEVTVASYFEERYKINLKYPYLPCLQAGDPSKGCYLPMEVCKIVSGQRCTKKLNEKQTREMIRGTARPAWKRKEEIMKIVNNAEFKKDEYARYFGLEVKPEMAEMEGRVLNPPAIQYGEQIQITPRNGAWDLRNATFHSARKIESWALLVAGSVQDCRQHVLENFRKEFIIVSKDVGMVISPQPACCEYLKGNPAAVEKRFKEIVANDLKLDLILVVLAGKTSVYATIKSLGDTLFGIPTQCVQVRNVNQVKRQTLANICLKINAKLGGINGVIPREFKPKGIFEKPVIFLGADVTHPSPGDERRPSIAAVVGSLDPYPMNYCTSIRIQKNRVEIISELASMVKELLIAFYRSTRAKPEKIIMYRDGVSEGQFAQVIQHELRAIRKACMLLEKNYEPGITFLVVQKRHHARFFPESNRDAVGKAGNIPPGTTVDTVICHPSEYDFYLCSHAGIQGTSRPAHYHVLWDDNDIKPDELQQLTYMLCHTYVRCTRSVSIPAPAYYAHLAAFRARFHVDHQRESSNGSDSESSKGNAGSEASLKSMAEACKPHDKLLKTIYFA